MCIEVVPFRACIAPDYYEALCANTMQVVVSADLCNKIECTAQYQCALIYSSLVWTIYVVKP